VFEFNLNQDELEALDSLLSTRVNVEGNRLPSWNYMGQNIWTMDLDGDASDVASDWTIETADVA